MADKKSEVPKRHTFIEQVVRDPAEDARSSHNFDEFYSDSDTFQRSINTRRRYSAFRPIPFPFDGADFSVGRSVLEDADPSSHTVLFETTTTPVETGEGESQRTKGASDLEAFLEAHVKVNSKKMEIIEEGLDENATHFWAGRNRQFLAFVILLGILTILQCIAFIVIFATWSSSEGDGLIPRTSTTPTPYNFNTTNSLHNGTEDPG